MKLYSELADWWPIMSAPADYEEEATLYKEIISKYKSDIKTCIELGSGGGNNASFLKKDWQMTLVDLSEHMLRVSEKLNPECEHIQSDMRHLKLNRRFDLIFIHDAIAYMKTKDDLRQVFNVAADHLADDGLLFIAPDTFTETFEEYTDHGGHDVENKSLRYLEWARISDQDPNLVVVDYVYLLKENGKTRTEHDQTEYGLFSKSIWQRLLEESGFKVNFEVIDHSELETGSYIGIIAQ